MRFIQRPHTARGARSFHAAVSMFFLPWIVGVLAKAQVQEPLNKMCPVMTSEEADPTITTVYKDTIIAFCCKRCLSKFQADPERYLERLQLSRDTAETPENASLPGGGSPDPQAIPSNSAVPSDVGVQIAVPPTTNEIVSDAQKPVQRGEAKRSERVQGGSVQTFADRLVGWLGKFHPASANIPIGMLLGAALAELLLLLTKRALFSAAGRFCLWVGAIGAIFTGMLGWFFGGFHWVDDRWIMTTHRWLGTATAVFSILLLVAGERAVQSGATGSRRTFRILLVFGTLAVLVTGFFGGSMIYGIDHYAW